MALWYSWDEGVAPRWSIWQIIHTEEKSHWGRGLSGWLGLEVRVNEEPMNVIGTRFDTQIGWG